MKSILFLAFFLPAIFFGQDASFIFQEGNETDIIGNEIHSYTLSLQKGELLQMELLQKDVDIQILALSPSNDTIKNFDSPNGANGLEIVELPISENGIYTFEVAPLIEGNLKGKKRQNFIDSINGSYQVLNYKILSSKQYKKKLALQKAKADSIISWIKDESITLRSVKAETGFKDLSNLKRILKSAKVVGLGETSHGSKEIFQMKHRMLEFLVEEMNFNVFAIEASSVGCRPINEYVLYGKGTSREALNEQGFWVWNTEEVIDMIEWMRTYNKTVSENKKVQFIGIDTQLSGSDLAYEKVSSFVKKTRIEEKTEMSTDSLFVKLKHYKNILDLSKERRKLYELLSFIVLHKERCIKLTSKQEYEDVLSCLRKIVQGAESNDRKLQNSVPYNIRDEYMAQGVLEAMRSNKPDTKIVLWAHNGHISKNSDSYTNRYKIPLGSALKKYIGNTYYAIGFSTNQGTFQARNRFIKEKKRAGAASFNIPIAKEGSLDWYFAQSRKDMFFINFNSPHTNTISNFLSEKRKTHAAGSTWSYEYKVPPIRDVEPGKSYDGMIFINETSSAVLTPGGEKEIEKRIKNGR